MSQVIEPPTNWGAFRYFNSEMSVDLELTDLARIVVGSNPRGVVVVSVPGTNWWLACTLLRPAWKEVGRDT